MAKDQFNISYEDLRLIRIGFKNFYRKNKLKPKPGAREEGCPPNTTRTNESRRNIWDPDDPEQRRDKLAFGKGRKKKCQ